MLTIDTDGTDQYEATQPSGCARHRDRMSGGRVGGKSRGYGFGIAGDLPMRQGGQMDDYIMPAKEMSHSRNVDVCLDLGPLNADHCNGSARQRGHCVATPDQICCQCATNKTAGAGNQNALMRGLFNHELKIDDISAKPG